MTSREGKALSTYQMAEIAWSDAGAFSSYGSQIKRIERAIKEAQDAAREKAHQECASVICDGCRQSLERDDRNEHDFGDHKRLCDAWPIWEHLPHGERK